MSWVDVGSDDLADGELRDVQIGELHLAVARAGTRMHAFGAWCTHAECPLTDGWIDGNAVRCACHGALFDLASGEALEGPATDPIRIFAVSVSDGRLQAWIDDGEAA